MPEPQPILLVEEYHRMQPCLIDKAMLEGRLGVELTFGHTGEVFFLGTRNVETQRECVRLLETARQVFLKE